MIKLTHGQVVSSNILFIERLEWYQFDISNERLIMRIVEDFAVVEHPIPLFVSFSYVLFWTMSFSIAFQYYVIRILVRDDRAVSTFIGVEPSVCLHLCRRVGFCRLITS